MENSKNNDKRLSSYLQDYYTLEADEGNGVRNPKYFIDGHTFKSKDEAVKYCVCRFKMSQTEACRYLFRLQRIYEIRRLEKHGASGEET